MHVDLKKFSSACSAPELSMANYKIFIKNNGEQS